jgi:predicted acylesterase/phospholipase RssA
MQPQPLTNIAISFSGGGYRATAYNLGTLSYLNHVQSNNEPLLKQVVMISTISGGTITGVKYALSLAKGESFEQFFTELYDFLQKDIIMDGAFKILNKPNNWDYKTKNKNLINAFSAIYQKHLFHDAPFGVLMDYTDKTGVEFMFNATDMRNAKPFRFQTKGKIGNFEHSISHETAKNIRLGDITASSSCFPGGFEPLVYPDDFMDTPPDFDKKDKLNIMDGGIVDNQGIESIWLAEARKSKDESSFVGTFIISDVARKEVIRVDEAENPSGLVHLLGKMSLRAYYYLSFFVLLFCSFAVFTAENKWIVAAASIVFTITAFIFFLYNHFSELTKSSLKKTLNQKTPKFLSDTRVISRISLNQLGHLLDVRIKSVLRLNQIVFLDRLRQLHYDSTYDDRKWRYRTISNLIYELPKYPDKLFPALKECVDGANNMDTTLWFSDAEKKGNKMLHDLIICGQATLCYTLKVYLEDRLKATDNPILDEFRPNIEAILAQLTEDFKKFNENPQWVLDGLVKG